MAIGDLLYLLNYGTFFLFSLYLFMALVYLFLLLFCHTSASIIMSTNIVVLLLFLTFLVLAVVSSLLELTNYTI